MGLSIGHGTGVAVDRAPRDPRVTDLTGLVSFGVIGDSFPEGQVASTTNNRMVNVVATRLGVTLGNFGIGGTVLQNSPDNTGSARANNGRDRFTQVMLGTSLRSLAGILYLFNDARWTGGGSITAANGQIDGAEMVSGLRERGPMPPENIIVATPWWINDAGFAIGGAGFTGQNRAGFEAYVTAARAVAEEYGTRFFDAYAFGREVGDAIIIGSDGIHPEDAGHAAYASGLLSAPVLNKRPYPATVSASSPGTGQLTITCAAVSGAASYEFEAGPSGSFSYPNATPAAGTSGTISSLAGDLYQVRARAVFPDGGKSPWAFSGVVVPVIGTTTFMLDTFTAADGTLATARAGELGATWTGHPAYGTPAMTIGANRLYCTNASGGVIYCSAVPSSADYKVRAELRCMSEIANDNCGISARMNATSPASHYFLRYSRSAGAFQLLKEVLGVFTTLGSWTDTFSAGSTRSIELRVVGSSPATITCYIDGAARITVTDSAITATGRPGMRYAIVQSASTGIHLDAILGTGI